MKARVSYFVILAIIVIASASLTGCSENTDLTGVGPIKKLELKPVDKALSDKGKVAFDTKCVACHKFDIKVVGPPLNGVTKRRKPEWIMNMILNPEQMTKENIIAKQLLAEHLTQMTFQNVTQDEARAILEYFRVNDGDK